MNALPESIVGIDLETTGLEPASAEIIEVAAIRYSLQPGKSLGGEETGEFTLLTKPAKPLSAQITAITGITNKMVAHQPAFSEVREKVSEFIGDSLVFAHNAPFDVGFLEFHGVELKHNPVWDTFTLAGVAWPEAISYNLGMLADQLQIKIEGEHRAGDDVRLTWQLLQAIYQQLQLSPATAHQAREILRKCRQEHYTQLFRERTAAASASSKETILPEAADAPKQNIGELEGIFAAGGPLAAALPNFSERPEQLAMARTIEKFITEETVGVIEAGTGTGKTFAYLVPLLRAISKKSRPALVATHTKNLQDQLIGHDIPKLLSALKLPYRAVSLKGRRNYICASRLEQALNRAAIALPEAWLLVKVLIWLDQGGSGELERLNTSHQDAHLLRHLHADALSCRRICARRASQAQERAASQPASGHSNMRECPYQQARREARTADIIVTNHALLMQLEEGEASLPLNHLVIDEAHHLEAAAREATSRDFSEHRVAELVAPFVRLASPKPPAKAGLAAPEPGEAVRPGSQVSRPIAKEAEDVLNDFRQILSACATFLAEHSPEGRLRLTESRRRNTSWQKIIQAGTQLRGRIKFLVGLLQSSQERHQASASPAESQGQVEAALLAGAIREAEKFSIELEIFLNGSSERIQWLEAAWPTRGAANLIVQLHDVALSVKPLISRLLEKTRSATLTSATLTCGGGFGFITSRLGIENEVCVAVGSSFNYRKQMLIYVVDDGLPPADPGYNVAAGRHIAAIATLLSGRLLGLFTSHDSVKAVYFEALNMLNKEKIKLFAQRITGGRHNIASRFRKNPSSVLLGTYSFWEGVDIPGDSLSCVVIAKLPFAPPTDPVMIAIAEAESLNAFEQLSVPNMIMKLRQGIGRLIRSHTDHGAVVILDGRFLHSGYGDTVIKSLPPATVHIGSGSDLKETLAGWFGQAELERWKKALRN